MKRKKNLDPNSPEVIEAVLEMIRKMTPEEAWAFMTYRTPGVEVTDMTGTLGDIEEFKRFTSQKYPPSSK